MAIHVCEDHHLENESGDRYEVTRHPSSCFQDKVSILSVWSVYEIAVCPIDYIHDKMANSGDLDVITTW